MPDCSRRPERRDCRSRIAEGRGDALVCQECERLDLPVTWTRVVKAPPAGFGGIGVAIRKTDHDDAIVVIDVLHGGPADRAGLRAGDRITRIGETDVATLDADAGRDALRGPAGSQVRLSVTRDGKPLALVAERAVIQLSP